MTDPSALKAELRRELPRSHQLRGLDLGAVARRDGRDDVLVRRAAGGATVYAVHLTWNVETDPAWPFTIAYASVDEFCERSALEEPDEA
ncbi:MAG: hypothetical protein ABR499_22335 [Gemmatimonadaceae bacterium]